MTGAHVNPADTAVKGFFLTDGDGWREDSEKPLDTPLGRARGWRGNLHWPMQHFADQCLDIAHLLLGGHLDEKKIEGEGGCAGKIAHALVTYLSQSGTKGEAQLEIAAQYVASQFYYGRSDAEGCALAALALASMGLNRLRNEIWKRFTADVQARIGQWMRTPLQLSPGERIYAIIQAIVAFGMGFVDRDQSDRMVEQYLIAVQRESVGGFVDTATGGLGGRYDVSGLCQLLLLREALRFHANVHIRERRLPTLRTCMQPYLRLAGHIIRRDGANWAFGEPHGPVASLATCAMLTGALADGWIAAAERAGSVTLLRLLFRHFFLHQFNREEGCMHGAESVADRMDAAHLLVFCCHFGRMVRENFSQQGTVAKPTAGGRHICFDRTVKKEQGLLLYTDGSGAIFQLPLIGGGGAGSDWAFPHCPGILECPPAARSPIFLPEFTAEGKVTTPSFYGKAVTTGLDGARNFQFRYEQPDLITVRGEIIPGMAACEARWTFSPNRLRADFSYTPRRTLRLDRFEYAVAVPAVDGDGDGLALGPGGIQITVPVDDFHGEWQPAHDVSQDTDWRTADGGQIRELHRYVRLLPLQLQVGRSYRFSIILDMDILSQTS
jgi:hypothetical protein